MQSLCSENVCVYACAAKYRSVRGWGKEIAQTIQFWTSLITHLRKNLWQCGHGYLVGNPCSPGEDPVTVLTRVLGGLTWGRPCHSADTGTWWAIPAHLGKTLSQCRHGYWVGNPCSPGENPVTVQTQVLGGLTWGRPCHSAGMGTWWAIPAHLG